MTMEAYPNSTALAVPQTCSFASIGDLRANAFVDFATAAFQIRPNAPCIAPFENFLTVTATEAAQNALVASSASANVRISSSCEGEAADRCFVPAAGCLNQYPWCVPRVVTFDAATFGAGADGWKPTDNSTLCTAKTTIDLSASVPLDLLSQPRSAPVSIGAHETQNCP